MSPNMANFRWSASSERAAVLIADDDLTDDQIAEECGVNRRTLTRWRTVPEFADKVEGHREEFRRKVLSKGIADRARRVQALDDMWNRMRRVIEERAADPELAKVPGGTTGLIVHNVKGVGKGNDFTMVDLYEVDTGLLREMREHAKQAAQELGQWTERSDLSATVKSYETGNGPEDL